MVLSEDLSQESHPCLWSHGEEHDLNCRIGDFIFQKETPDSMALFINYQ